MSQVTFQQSNGVQLFTPAADVAIAIGDLLLRWVDGRVYPASYLNEENELWEGEQVSASRFAERFVGISQEVSPVGSEVPILVSTDAVAWLEVSGSPDVRAGELFGIAAANDESLSASKVRKVGSTFEAIGRATKDISQATRIPIALQPPSYKTSRIRTGSAVLLLGSTAPSVVLVPIPAYHAIRIDSMRFVTKQLAADDETLEVDIRVWATEPYSILEETLSIDNSVLELNTFEAEIDPDKRIIAAGAQEIALAAVADYDAGPFPTPMTDVEIVLTYVMWQIEEVLA